MRGLGDNLLLLLLAVLGSITSARAEPPPSPNAAVERAAAESSDLELARAHFQRGVAHFDREEWSAALVEFLKSRELAVTKGNTKNAAICLRKVGRFDESLRLFEALIADFPDLAPEERELAERELADLTASVGSVEIRDAPPGARVSIDGVDRGATPLAGPVRLSAGTHVIRVSKDGSLPFEARIDLAGRQAAVVSARLTPVTRAGRLRVRERHQRAVDVIVDATAVGSAPWEGALSPGRHSVFLRGAGALGTPPASVDVTLDRVTELELVAVELRSVLRVDATPSTAAISVDGVLVGHGSWEGRLAPGAHRVTLAASGYAPFARRVELAPDARTRLSATLERPASRAPQIALELDTGAVFGLLWGGELVEDCTGDCSAGLPFGAQGRIHARYELPSGLGLGIRAGYLRLARSLEARATPLVPVRLPEHTGVADDRLRLGGLLLGGEAQYARGERWPLAARVSAGALIGSVTDDRSGRFTSPAGTEYTTRARAIPRAAYLFIAPELRVARRLGRNVELSVGLELLILTALGVPRWEDERSGTVVPDDGLAFFPGADLTGGLVLAATPSLGVTYAF